MDNENAPATKKDLAELATSMDQKLSDMEERLSERIRDSQTGILKAFLRWQQSVHTQFRKLEANMGNNVTSIEERMGILERRLWEIEKRLLMNPPAA
jgi:hypothetical protein